MLNAVNEVNKIASTLGSEKEKSKSINMKKTVHEIFHTREDHAFNYYLCSKFVKPFIFTDVQRVKTVGFLIKQLCNLRV